MELSNRAQKMSLNVNFMKNNSGRVRSMAYDPVRNPQGVVNLGTAENKLIEDLICEKMREEQSFRFEPWMQYYFASFGILSLRTALAKFIQTWFKAAETIDPENINVTSGCGAAMELIFYLITDPGDCVLLPTPFYAAIESKLFRDEVNLFHVITKDENFQVTSTELEEAYSKAEAQGLKVKAVFITNPDNPSGISKDRKSIEDILQFSQRHNIHTVINEIYALSTFTDDNPFCSVLSLPKVPLPQKTHLLWSFSKDFGVSGLRCGIIYSKLDFSKFSTLFFMETPPSIVQDTLAKLLTDEKWLNEAYFPTYQSRIKKAYKDVCEELRSMNVEPFQGYNAGFFVWADFRKIMKTCTKEEEMKLYEIFFAEGVYIIPGQIFYCPFPGWFRITFTYQPDQTKIGLERLKKGIAIYRQGSGQTGAH